MSSMIACFLSLLPFKGTCSSINFSNTIFISENKLCSSVYSYSAISRTNEFLAFKLFSIYPFIISELNIRHGKIFKSSFSNNTFLHSLIPKSLYILCLSKILDFDLLISSFNSIFFCNNEFIASAFFFSTSNRIFNCSIAAFSL